MPTYSPRLVGGLSDRFVNDRRLIDRAATRLKGFPLVFDLEKEIAVVIVEKKLLRIPGVREACL
jgi:hypothetical protein